MSMAKKYRQGSYYLFIALLLCLFAWPWPLSASPLTLTNSTNQEIINILVRPQDGAPLFLRLDLSPGGSDQVDNPSCKASLRVDTGLEFWLYDQVDLAKAKKLTFCDRHELCLVIQDESGGDLHIAGKAENLVPAPGDRPVCGLESFHPLMPMKEVCELLSPDTPVDDNGSLLAGLGFAGLVWAARLAPAQNGPMTDATRLEHLELRRPLSREDLARTLSFLSSKGYVPWQAEFPANDMDFTEDSVGKKEAALKAALDKFLNSASTGQAAIMLAPAGILPALDEGDAPRTDVQLFTLVLKPGINTLLVDVAAYQGADK